MTVLATMTYSEFAALLDCPRKWFFRYKERLDTKKPKSKLDLGSAVHDAIELFYKEPTVSTAELQKMVLKKLEDMMIEHKEKGGYPHEEEEAEEMRALATSMIEQYLLYARKNDDFKIVSLEEEFDLPVINPYTGTVHEHLRLQGKVDGTCTVNDKANMILEHKTAADNAEDWWWKYLNQIDFYTYALQRKHDVEFHGAYLNILMKKIPRVPEPLKKGGLSKKKIVTTAEIYRQAVIDNELDLADYQDILEKLEKFPPKFIVRKPVYRNQDDLIEIEKTIWWAINRKLKMTHYPRNKSDQCGWKCSFKELCVDDLPEVRAEHFRVRDSEHAELSGNQQPV